MNQTQINFSPDVEQYMHINGYKRIDGGAIENGMCFIKNHDKAVIFCEGHIDCKVPGMHNGAKQLANVMFGWKSVAKYDGFDGHNRFHLMMLLHIMKAVAFNDFMNISRATDPSINIESDFGIKKAYDFPLLRENACQL